MFKFVFCAAIWHQKNLTSPFFLTIALLCCSKMASPEPFATIFRLQNQNLNKLLEAMPKAISLVAPSLYSNLVSPEIRKRN
ncbi:hypothetical protein [Rufibacter sp. LB8]|uniref:hypothetical protein n=1 Tax=Rufibacter sp. LB8 TaxID=2777781 RepID=UPI00178C44A5|nr:hypothetical protein [Rufibacter sp. LB8]